MEDQKLVDTSINTAEQPAANNMQTVGQPKDVAPTNTDPQVKVGEKEKVFNQAQLDEIVISRLGKERARLLKKLGIEDETQLEELATKAKSYQDAASKLQQYETEKLNTQKVDVLAELKADKDFTDYLLSKIEFGDSIETFKANANKYLEENPRFRVENFKRVDSQVSVNRGAGYPDLANMTPEQYLAWRAKNKL